MWAVLLYLASGSSAQLGVRTDGHMSVRGVADESVKVAAGPAGWSLPVALPSEAGRCRAELRDVSPIPGHLLKWVETLDNTDGAATLTLDPRRYVGSHTYRLAIHCGLREIQHAYVHLLGTPDDMRPARFELDSSREADASEILTVPKGQL